MSKKRKHRINPELAKMLARKSKVRKDIEQAEQHELSLLLHLRTGLKPDIFLEEVKRIVSEGEIHFQPLLDAVKDEQNPNQALQTIILDTVFPNHLPIKNLPPLTETEIKPIGYKPPKWDRFGSRIAITTLAAMAMLGTR